MSVPRRHHFTFDHFTFDYLTYYSSDFTRAQEFDQPWDHTHIQDGLNPLCAAIGKVGESPTAVAHYLFVGVAEQVGEGREELGGGGGKSQWRGR